jgi:DNA invertase Pin-like site-specific DNA recombinase
LQLVAQSLLARRVFGTKGKKLGRPKKVMDATRIAKLRAQGSSWRAIATQLDVGLATLHRQSVPRSKTQETDFGTR